MKHTENLIIRLALAIILGIPYFFKIFYIIFGPITIYLSYAVLRLLGYSALLRFDQNIIRIGCYNLEFIEACTAASAFYLLFLLVVLTKDLTFKKRIYIWLTGAALILLMNIIRIVILIVVLLNSGVNWFNTIHLTFWKFVSTIYVVLVWLFLVKKFKIKEIPVYSDLKELYKKVTKNSKKNKKA